MISIRYLSLTHRTWKIQPGWKIRVSCTQTASVSSLLLRALPNSQENCPNSRELHSCHWELSGQLQNTCLRFSLLTLVRSMSSSGNVTAASHRRCHLPSPLPRAALLRQFIYLLPGKSLKTRKTHPEKQTKAAATEWMFSETPPNPFEFFRNLTTHQNVTRTLSHTPLWTK